MTYQRLLFVEVLEGCYRYWHEQRDYINTVIESNLDDSGFIH